MYRTTLYSRIHARYPKPSCARSVRAAEKDDVVRTIIC